MVFDLGAMLRRKGEFESARLDDFAFRQRGRAMRLLAARLAADPGFAATALSALDAEALAVGIALADDAAILAALADPLNEPQRAALKAHWQAAFAEARRQLIAERGDPTPVRLG